MMLLRRMVMVVTMVVEKEHAAVSPSEWNLLA